MQYLNFRLGVYSSGVLENSNTPLSQGLTPLGQPHNMGPMVPRKGTPPFDHPHAGFFQQPASGLVFNGNGAISGLYTYRLSKTLTHGIVKELTE